MDSTIERKTMRKVTLRIVPFIMLLYFVAYIDRVNIGVAGLTMNKDLGFSPAVFGFGAGIFFWGYFLCEVPSNIILDKVGARLWIARVMITWGLSSAAMAFVWDATSFYVLRFVLGAAEAGFFPGIILYLSYWFPAHRRAAVTSLFMAAVPISVIIGSPLSSALLELDGILGLKGWQWLFILEAIPAVILGFVVLFYMTDRPEKATWLADDERAWLVETMNAERAKKAGHASHSIWAGLSDLRVVALALVYFGTSAGLYTLSIWVPQIIKEFGLSTMHVGLFSSIPPLVAVFAMYCWARHSDRQRRAHVACRHRMPGRGDGTSVGGSFHHDCHSDHGPYTCEHWDQFGKAASLDHANDVPGGTGCCNGYRGDQLDWQSWRICCARRIGWIKQETGSFAGGLYFVAGLLIVSAIITLVLARSLQPPQTSAPLTPEPKAHS